MPSTLRYETPKKYIISIILPVFNVETYIRDCLDSILAQDDKNYEVIAVDDGGTDNSISIVQEYIGKINNLSIIHQTNRGLGGARNTGVGQAKGQFLVFVDSDDIIAPDFISSLRRNQIKMNADIISGRFCKVTETGEFLKLYEEPKCVDASLSINYHEKILGTISSSVAWGRLIRKQLLLDTNLKFPENIPHEDWFYTYKLIRSANTIGFTENVIYSWRQRNSSLGNSMSRKYISILPSLRKDTSDYLTGNNATEREFAFAARRNLHILKVFRSKINRYKADCLDDFHEMLFENQSKYLDDLNLFEASSVHEVLISDGIRELISNANLWKADQGEKRNSSNEKIDREIIILEFRIRDFPSRVWAFCIRSLRFLRNIIRN